MAHSGSPVHVTPKTIELSAIWFLCDFFELFFLRPFLDFEFFGYFESREFSEHSIFWRPIWIYAKFL